MTLMFDVTLRSVSCSYGMPGDPCMAVYPGGYWRLASVSASLAPPSAAWRHHSHLATVRSTRQHQPGHTSLPAQLSVVILLLLLLLLL